MVDAVQRTEDFIATFADDTRADLDGTAVVWNADDHLTIFTKTSHNRQYRVKDLSANGRSATFEYVGYTGSDKTAISNNYAVYPYDAEATILGDVITTTLASEQTYNAECDLTYALMSAKSATNNFSFVNSGALLRFNISTILPDTFDLNYIKVSSQSHNIAGEVTIDTNDHLAVVTNNGTNEITLAEINETIDSDVKSFYIAMPAMSFEKSDLSVTFSFADGNKTFALPAFDLEQGKIKSIDYTIKDAEEFTGSTPGEDEPIAAKPANNEIWYTSEYDISKYECWMLDYDSDVNIVSEVWNAETGKGILTFNGDVKITPRFYFDLWAEMWYMATGEIPNVPITSVTLPECVTTILDYAFYHCLLLEINIPDSVTTIGEEAFAWCRSLTSVTIPDSVTSIGEGAFYGCSSLTSVTIGDSVTTIGESAFYNCSSLTEFRGKYASEDGRCLIVDGILNSIALAGLTEYTIPASVTAIGGYPFRGCSSLTSVTIPDSVTEIGVQEFYECSSLTSITIGDSVTTIGVGAFQGCSSLQEFNGKFASEDGRCLIVDGILNSFAPAGLTEYTIPDSVTEISVQAFSNCDSLTSVTIPDSVTTIGGSAFSNCDSLTSVTIPNSVTTIGELAFYRCSRLTSIYCKAVTPPAGGLAMFDGNASGRTIYVPMESVEAYKSAEGWSDYKSSIVGYNF